MKHRKKGKKLGRNTSQRKALFKGLLRSLVIHEKIETTQAKAKAVRGLVAKIIKLSKDSSLHSTRQLLAFLQDKKVVKKLKEEIAPRFKKKKSGFTRFIRLRKRKGDDALMVRLEFTKDKKKSASEDNKKKRKKSKKKK